MIVSNRRIVMNSGGSGVVMDWIEMDNGLEMDNGWFLVRSDDLLGRRSNVVVVVVIAGGKDG